MKRNNGRVFAVLLRRIARELESLSDDALERLAESSGLLLLSQDAVKAAAKGEQRAPVDNKAIVERLRVMGSREDGIAFLKVEAPTRDQLVRIARAMDLPITNRHTIEQVVDRIVEATIGFRIRSAAIRGADSDAVVTGQPSGEAGENSAESGSGNAIKSYAKPLPSKQR